MSLFHQLVRNGVLVEDRVLDVPSGELRDVIRFAFERISDHLKARAYLQTANKASLLGLFEAGGQLHFAVEDEAAIADHKGLLAELAVQLPEITADGELVDIPLDPERRCEILPIVIDSLAWRSCDSITDRTRQIVMEALETLGLAWSTMDVLLNIGCRPRHPLNAIFLHGLLASSPLTERDALLSPYLHERFGQRGVVDRLLRWALEEDLHGVSSEAAELWLRLFAWFCSASDRRIRDHATKAMVRVGEAHPHLWADLIGTFSAIDDDYVVERCLGAASAHWFARPTRARSHQHRPRFGIGFS